MSPGRARGRAWVWQASPPLVDPPSAGASVEFVRLERALRAAEDGFHEQRARLRDNGVGTQWLELLDAHAHMVRDPMLAGRAAAHIARGASAAQAIRQAAAEISEQLVATGAPPLIDRVVDVQQVRDAILHGFAPTRAAVPPSRRSLRPIGPAIVVTQNMPPADLLELCGPDGRPGIAGLCIAEGGRLAHVSILARHLGIPTVSGLSELWGRLDGGEPLIVDGDTGEIWSSPPPNASAHPRPVVAPVEGLRLLANLHHPEEGPQALACGAEGVGLLRTDPMRTAAGLPTEAEQTRRYSALCRTMAGLPVTIRTFDLPPDGDPSPMGLRGVRWMRSHPDAALAQLRAICRAGAHGPVRVLVPMVSRVADAEQARALLQQAWEDAGRPAQRPPLGVMIETPAAALLTDRLLASADFVAVGTNDLLQFLVGADRRQAQTAPWLAAAEAAVEPLLATIAAAAGPHAYVCGALAADPDWLPRLRGLGFSAVSLPPRRIRQLRSGEVPRLDTAPGEP